MKQPGIEGMMKQGSNRRPRSRGNPNSNNKQRSGGRNSYDSNGPAGKVRGTAQQVLDKYQALGRDAMTAGDRIAAESFFQFAEHYHRIVNVDGAPATPTQNNQNNQNGQNQNRHDRQGSDQPEVVVDVPVIDVSAEETAPEVVAEPASSEAVEAVIEPVLDLGEPPAAPKEEAPKAPRRRRSRAKVETAEA